MRAPVLDRRRFAWALVITVGVGLRLAAASGRGLWIDEAFTYEVVTASPREALRLMLT